MTILCRSCHAEAHPFGDAGYHVTGCDCIPLELVELPANVGKAYDALQNARDARDAALERVTRDVERMFAPIIAQRKWQLSAAIERARGKVADDQS